MVYACAATGNARAAVEAAIMARWGVEQMRNFMKRSDPTRVCPVALSVVLLSFAAACAHEPWHPAKGLLATQWASQVTPANAWPEYPRPQLVRNRWMNLNGLWEYAVTARDTERPERYDGRILVPFPLESPLSGVMKPLLPGQRLWYRREFTVPAEWAGQRVLLHFGAVDWEATVTVDGHGLGTHRGGYDGFSFDITKQVAAGGKHQIVVSVWDPTDSGWQLHGKQSLHPGGCSYTASSGIWQTVWLEPVPESYIDGLVATPDPEAGLLSLTVNARTVPGPLRVEAVALEGDRPVATIAGGIGTEITPQIQLNLVKFFKAKQVWVTTRLKLPIPHVRAWTPDAPFLYGLTVRLKDGEGRTLDSVTSYFGMRSVRVGRDTDGAPRMLLNGQPVLMPGALDQGYWPDGIYLAPTDEALRFDIAFAKKLGLNAVRKHVKVEPQRWYYWADRLGLMVLQDMQTGNCGDPFTDLPHSPEAADQWRAEVSHVIEEKLSHPSIVCWNLFNEAFGGFDYARNTTWAQQLDPSRLINASSGFPWHGGGDVLDGHGGIDFKEIRAVSIISEAGTPSLGCAGHQWPHAWSYGSYDPRTGETMDFLAYYNKNRETAVLPELTPEASVWLTEKVGAFFRDFLRNTSQSWVSGLFYCQLVDVETECNGLISFDRAVPKVDPGKIAESIRIHTPGLRAQ